MALFGGHCRGYQGVLNGFLTVTWKYNQASRFLVSLYLSRPACVVVFWQRHFVCSLVVISEDINTPGILEACDGGNISMACSTYCI